MDSTEKRICEREARDKGGDKTVPRKRPDGGKSPRAGGSMVLNAENNDCYFLIRYHVCICVFYTHCYWCFYENMYGFTRVVFRTCTTVG